MWVVLDLLPLPQFLCLGLRLQLPLIVRVWVNPNPESLLLKELRRNASAEAFRFEVFGGNFTRLGLVTSGFGDLGSFLGTLNPKP